MGLFTWAHRKHGIPKPHNRALKGSRSRFHACRIEQMESRELLSVTPIQIGATFFEDHSGDDKPSILASDGTTQVADLFQVSYTGGANGTQLTSLTIDLHDTTLFDTVAGGIGYGGAFPLKILSHTGFELVDQNGNEIDTVNVADGATSLTMYFKDFNAGEKLVFTVDLDEAVGGNSTVNGAEIVDQKLTISGTSYTAKGATIEATFTAPHMENADVSTSFTFIDRSVDPTSEYFSGALYDLLPNVEYNNAAAEAYMPTIDSTETNMYEFTAGALGGVTQVPLNTLSGYVYVDANNNGIYDSGETPLGDVTIKLWDADGNLIATTTTNESGYYDFIDLAAGAYKLTETQPAGYQDGKDAVGTVNGNPDGALPAVDNDSILSISLAGGEDGVQYNFGELPNSLSGYVYIDANNNGVYDSGETPIGGVTVNLWDSNGNLVATATTDDNGYYIFGNLAPATYSVTEVQPDGYLDGLDAAGSAGGTAHNPNQDLIDGIKISAVNATDYDFGELLPVSISGLVFYDQNGNNIQDGNEPGIQNVTVTLYQLVDGKNVSVATTATDDNGKYSFTGLTPGTYCVEETQPSAYLEGGDSVGYVGENQVGSLDGYDRLVGIKLNSGEDGVDYDFWEIKGATISGYVFQDGPAIQLNQGDPVPYIPSVRDGKLTADDTRLANVTLTLCDATGVPLLDSHGNQITTVTDANGYYEFTGLAPGQYSIKEIQPNGYITGVDTAGSAGGLVVNKYSTLDASVLSTLAVTTSDTAIVRITLASGDAAVQYNFSEVLVQYQHNGPPFNPIPPVIPPYPTAQQTYIDQPIGYTYYLTPQWPAPLIYCGGGMPGGYTWHLSVIDAGQPRQEASDSQYVQVSQSSLFDPISWTGAEMDQGLWILADKDGVPIKKFHFGMHDATPVTGDWDGSGTTKIGVFIDGLWFLDLNGNGVWDKGDLWVKLGKKGDQPVTGDWNGDGKTDIGIFGPEWLGDTAAIAAEPGLPSSLNPPNKSRPKNVPPDPTEATIGYRTLKKTNAGKMRSDLIDHVFQYGDKGDIAVTGDWNGDGIYTIGIFRDGVWYLDMDGDGRWSDGDLIVEFGQPGDLPVVGDWTGDGVSKLGVYRNGTFYLDTNNNHQIDAADKVIQLGHPGDKPVAGDWDGDGVDKVGVYEDGAPANVPLQAARQ